MKLRNKLTIIIDKDHGETAELPRLERQLQGVSGISEIQVVDNSGRATTWLISVITCPSM